MRSRKKLPLAELFFRRVKKLDKSQGEHWLWTGRTNKAGTTPMFSWAGDGQENTNRTAFYFAYLLKYGEPPPMTGNAGRRKSCGVPLCVNPEHYTNGNPSAFSVMEERDRAIVEVYSQHMLWKNWTLAKLGKHFKLSKQRVLQIVKNSGAWNAEVQEPAVLTKLKRGEK